MDPATTGLGTAMREPQDNRWELFKARLGQRIGAEDAAAWLGGLRLEALEPQRVVLSGIPNSFFKSRILHPFRPATLSALGESFPEIAFGRQPELELRVAAENGAARPRPAAAAALACASTPPEAGSAPAAARQPEAGERNPLETFLAAPGAAAALGFARNVAASPGARYNPLLLVGASGLGKTHLVQGIARALRDRQPTWNVLYVTGEAFKNEVLDGITHRRMAAVR